MALPQLPADGLNPWGTPLRSVLTDISNRADQGISDAAAAQDDVDTVGDIVDEHETDIANHNTRIGTLETTVATKAADNVVVKLSGNQNITGTKTFTSAPVVPDNSFAIGKINGLQTALNAKVNSNNPSFTGTISGIDKADIGLANVDNTTDAQKPVSNATQTALNLKADASDLSSRVQTHNHTGGSNGVNIPISAVTNLQTNLNAKQKTLSTAQGTSVTYNTSDFSIDDFYIHRWGAICFVSMTITTKFGANTVTGDIPNTVIGTIQTTSQFYDLYQGSGDRPMRYPLSSMGTGMLATGCLVAETRQFLLTAAAPVAFGSGYQFSLGGIFCLNTDS